MIDPWTNFFLVYGTMALVIGAITALAYWSRQEPNAERRSRRAGSRPSR